MRIKRLLLPLFLLPLAVSAARVAQKYQAEQQQLRIWRGNYNKGFKLEEVRSQCFAQLSWILRRVLHVRMVIAGLSLIVSIIVLGTVPTWVEREKCWEICVWNHACLLQIMGGIFLFVASIKTNHWLFLPWLVAACIFIYTLLYKSVTYFYHLEGRKLMVVPLFQTIAGFWCYFVYDVFQDFLHLHGQRNHINLSN